jgi:glycosyltransferase involved in cell wall biosynthesis
MKILLIIEGTYPWYRGGVSEWVYQYLKHLSEHQFTILQIATDEFHSLNPEDALYPLTDNIADFIRIPPPTISSQDYNQYLESWYQSQFDTVLKSGNNPFQAIHVTNTGFAGWLGAKLSSSLDVPMLLTEHAIYWKEIEMGAVALECGYKIPASDEAKRNTITAFKEFASFTYSNASQIVTVSDSNISFQEDLGALDIEYIPNGIPASWLLEEKERGSITTIGWVGRCAEMKNPLAFFDLIEQFRDMNFDANYTMLLSDANEKKLEQTVKNRAKDYPEVRFVWNQPAKEYFTDFDFLAITSHNESQPLVMLEALAKRALPVGFEVGDLTEEYGLVIGKEKSIQKLAREIADLWTNRDVFDSYVSTRFEKVKEEHTWDNIFRTYDQLISEVSEMEAISSSE